MKVLSAILTNPWCLKNIGIGEGVVYSGVESLVEDDINESLNYSIEEKFIDFHEDFCFKPTVLASANNSEFSYQKTQFKNANELCLLLAHWRSRGLYAFYIKKNDILLEQFEIYMKDNIENRCHGGFGHLFNYFFDKISASNSIRMFDGEDVLEFQSNAYAITGNIDLLLEVQSTIIDYHNMPEVQVGFSYKTSTDFYEVNKNDNLEWLGPF